jgi:hypothetical protein
MKLLKPLEKTEGKSVKKRKKIRRRGFFGKFQNTKRVSKKIKQRDNDIKRRKNFLPSLILTILFWMATTYMILFVDPLSRGSVQLFFISLSFSLLFTGSLIFANKRRGILLTLSIIFFLILRYFGVGNIINVLLIAGLTITAEIYFSIN